MGLSEICNTLVETFLLPLYGVYALLGLILLIAGIFFATDEASQDFVTFGTLIAGGFMLVTGGAGGFASFKKIWPLMAIVELVNIALFIVLIAAMMVALILGSGTKDPNAKLWQTVYGMDPVEASSAQGTLVGIIGTNKNGYTTKQINAQLLSRAVQYTQYCSKSDVKAVVDGCKDFKATNPSSATAKEIFGNCSSSVTGKTGTQATAMAACNDCADACMKQQIQLAADNMQTLVIVVFATFGFLTVDIMWNNMLLSGHIGDGDWDGLKGQIGLFLNGLIAILGFALLILAAVSAADATDEANCPTQKDKGACVGSTVYGLLAVGVFLFIVGGITAGSVFKNIKQGVRFANLFLALLALIMLIMGIFVAIVSGAMEDVNKKYDDNFQKLKNAANTAASQAKETAPCPDAKVNGCLKGKSCAAPADPPPKIISAADTTKNAAYAVAVGQDVAACKAKLQEDMRSSMTSLGIFSMIVLLYMLVVIYASQKAVGVWRKGDDSDE